MEFKKRIEYNMYRPGKNLKINPEHLEALEESAMNRIMYSMKEGYTEGELIDNIRINEEDGEDGIEYSGYFKVNDFEIVDGEEQKDDFVLEETEENMFRANDINFNWSRDNGENILSHHIEALEETAMDRIFEMYEKGYTSGELFDNIFMNDNDIENGEEGISYSGYWAISPITPIMKKSNNNTTVITKKKKKSKNKMRTI